MHELQRDRLGVLLERALALPVEERSGFVAGACGSDRQLRENLATLIAAYESSSGYFEGLAEQIVEPVLAAAAEVPHDDVAIGQRVSHYEILERIGDGGMGVVYRARDLRLGRVVALKFLPPQLARDDAARASLLAEAQAASALDHPNIGVVHEIGETEAGGLFIAMGWYEGETLKQKLQRAPLPVPETLTVAIQIADALAAAHGAGIIHRDVKPSNILITRQGRAKLVDFGIAKVAGAEMTREGTTLGTVAYMSPEQTRGVAVDARTDLWSVGVVLYEMLTGQRPFQGESDDIVIYAIRHDDPAPLERLRPDVPAGLAAIVASCLTKDPARRHERANDLLADLQVLKDGTERSQGIRGRVSRGDSAPPEGARGHGLPVRRAAGIAAGVGMAAVAAIYGYVASIRSPPPALDPQRVVVARFDNRTSQPALDPLGSMAADWIIHGLSHTGLVDVLPVASALSAADFVLRMPGGTDTAERIRLLAQETGAGIVVTGAYYQQGDSLYLRATVTDGGRGRVLQALEPIATHVALPLEGIEQLRQRLMGALATHLNPRMREHAARTGRAPPSFAAYRAHAEGLELFVARDWRAALTRFAEAAGHDSSFLAPLLFSGLAFTYLGDLTAVDSILVLARPRLHLLHEADRLGFDFLEARVRGDLAAAHRAHRRSPELAPGGLAHWGLANSALWVNRPRETIQVSRQLDPERGELRGWFFYWRDLASAHHRLGEHREELRVARRARELFPDEGSAVLLEVRALAALRRHRELNRLLAEAVHADRNSVVLLRAAGQELLAHGASAAGETQLRAAMDLHRSQRADDPRLPFFVANSHRLVGELDEAERLLGELTVAQPEVLRMNVQGMLGGLAARRGDAGEAARISSWLAELDNPYLRGGNTYFRARIASLLGEREEALRLLQQSHREGLLDFWLVIHTEPDFAFLRDYPPFQEFVRPKG
jgi:tetratricopeptide (TPR) repeat protein